jgi:hypothetical protein
MTPLAASWELWTHIGFHIATSSLVPSFEMLDTVPQEPRPGTPAASVEDAMAVSKELKAA